jgi:hypothetical protein
METLCVVLQLKADSIYFEDITLTTVVIGRMDFRHAVNPASIHHI